MRPAHVAAVAFQVVVSGIGLGVLVSAVLGALASFSEPVEELVIPEPYRRGRFQ